MQRPVPPGDVYSQRYKGISLCLSMLSRALNGSYVNFGVFELYNDSALQSALDAAMKMALSIHPEEVRPPPPFAAAPPVAPRHGHASYFRVCDGVAKPPSDGVTRSAVAAGMLAWMFFCESMLFWSDLMESQ